MGGVPEVAARTYEEVLEITVKEITESIPVSRIPDQLCADLEFLFTDIDDTITYQGMMPSETLDAVYRLSYAGVKVVLVTGRPAGWCDYFARMWPVSGIIGENGAFYFSYNREIRKMKRTYLLSEEERRENRKKLNVLERKILLEVPACRISADQPFRIADLAVDICEDVEALSKEEIGKICSIARGAGAEYKISSIHINCWYGTYDKLTCFDRFLSDCTGGRMADYQERMIYCGDSPNDEPMFKALNNTVAVANIEKYLDVLEHLPAYITSGKGAHGFAELTNHILRKRNGTG